MKKTLLALALLAPLSLAAQEPRHPSYSYVEAGYVRFDNGLDFDGWGVNGSFGIGDFHLFAGFSDLDPDDGIGIIAADTDWWRAGFGYRMELNPQLDLVARASYRRMEFSGIGSDDGWDAEVGARSLLMPKIEGYVFAGYEDLEGSSGDFFGRLGGVWHFTPNWGLNADVKFTGGERMWFIGPRYSF